MKIPSVRIHNGNIEYKRSANNDLTNTIYVNEAELTLENVNILSPSNPTTYSYGITVNQADRTASRHARLIFHNSTIN